MEAFDQPSQHGAEEQFQQQGDHARKAQSCMSGSEVQEGCARTRWTKEAVRDGRKPPPRPHTRPSQTARQPTTVTRQRQYIMSKAEQHDIDEYDEAGNVVATYIVSDNSRVDVVVRNILAFASCREGYTDDAQLPQQTKSYVQQLLDVFLPAGYPHSVTEDYTRYVCSNAANVPSKPH